MGHLSWRWLLTILYLCTATQLAVALFWYLLVWETFSVSFHIVHLDGCSLNSSNFGVRVGGGELKVLPVHSVGHSPLVLRNLKPTVGQGCVPPGSSGEIVLDFQCLDAACIPWFMALSSHHFTLLLPESYLLLSFVTLNKREYQWGNKITLALNNNLYHLESVFSVEKLPKLWQIVF